MVELDISDCISSARITDITGVLHAVIESGNGMLAIVVRIVLVDNAGDVLAVDTRCTSFTLFTRLTLFGLDDGRRDAIIAILAIQADGTIFAILTTLAIFADCDLF